MFGSPFKNHQRAQGAGAKAALRAGKWGAEELMPPARQFPGKPNPQNTWVFHGASMGLQWECPWGFNGNMQAWQGWQLEYV
jgi:hypothetical protein